MASAAAAPAPAAVRERPVRAVVVDLRFNTGGNLTLASDLMADRPASPTWDAYRAGIDVALEADLRRLARDERGPGRTRLLPKAGPAPTLVPLPLDRGAGG